MSAPVISRSVPSDREILVHGGKVKYIHNIRHNYHSNRVVTSQYTWWNFLPKNIFIQFCNRANLYFLLIGILQIIPMSSTTNGIPTIYSPLLCIIVVGAIRAAAEDRARHIADKQRNHAKFWRLASDEVLSRADRAEARLLFQPPEHDNSYPEIPWLSCGTKFQNINRVSVLPGERPPAPSPLPSSPTSPTDADEGWFMVSRKKPSAKSALVPHAHLPMSPASPLSIAAPPFTDPAVQRERLVAENAALCVVNSGDLKVGSLVKVYKNQMIPCDMLILGTSEPRGHCFIDKANLNGETTLEVVNAPPGLRPYITADGTLLKQVLFHVAYEAPSSNFEKFRCNITATPPDAAAFAMQVNQKQLLLRETVLRNSDWAFGMVLYTGDDTRIRRSVAEGDVAPVKTSRIMRLVDRFITTMFLLQLVLCLAGGVYAGYWRYYYSTAHWYLYQDGDLSDSVSTAIAATFSWMILLSSMVPISLVVSAQMCKFAESWFIEWDLSLFEAAIGKPAKCNTSAVHEDLGLVDFIFSDKTGTLTQNKMEFRYGVVAVRDAPPPAPEAPDARTQAAAVAEAKDKAQTETPEIDLSLFSPPTSPSALPTAPRKGKADVNVNSNPNTPAAASSLVCFGSADTDIARAVKHKLSQAPHAFDMAPLYPSSNPLAYRGLPQRWTDLILPIVKPIRATAAIPQEADLRAGMSVAHATQKARLELLRGGWAGHGLWSRMWHTSQGRFYPLFIHARKAWMRYVREGRLEKHRRAMRANAESPIGLAPPPLAGSVSKTSLRAAQSHEPLLSGQCDSTELAHAYSHGPSELARVFSNDYLTSVLHAAAEPSEEPSTVELNPMELPLHTSLSVPAAPAEPSEPSEDDEDDEDEDDAVSQARAEAEAVEQAADQARTALRRTLDNELAVPDSFLGAFGTAERSRLLKAVWGPNWGDDSASAAQRHALFTYLRNLALSSTVKPFRKPDGGLDWQFESAEELSMARFAAACGFVRENHPSGVGTVLYVREYLSEDLTAARSRIHVETYHCIATLGFTSRRARVSVIWQRQPFKHAVSEPAPAPASAAAMMEQPVQDARTAALPSAYLDEYDTERIARRSAPTQGAESVSGRVLVMCKGQDAVVLPLLQDVPGTALIPPTEPRDADSDVSVGYDDPHHPLQAQLREMASNGLRMLLAGYADLPADWWAGLEQDYATFAALDDDLDATAVPGSPSPRQTTGAPPASDGASVAPADSSPLLTALSARLRQAQDTAGDRSPVSVKLLRAALSEHIEHSAGLSLLGCLAMEDKLQPLVPEAIRDFSRAGIRVWMITGDKLETARNIALACELVDADMVMSQQQLSVNARNIAADTSLLSFASDALPLAVRAAKGRRLLEVTAEWHKLCMREPGIFGQVFDALDEGHHGRISLGYLQRCVLALGVEVTLPLLAYVMSTFDQPLVTAPADATPFTMVTRATFIAALHALVDTVTVDEAVYTDVEQGIETFLSTPADLPLALLVNRDAFTVLCPSTRAEPHQASAPESPSAPSPITPAVSKRFFALAAVCKSVVFARAEPAMKKRMVSSVALMFPSAVTLAIGDGANDTEMITAASVGIGLSGVEGTAASNSADYALCSFRMLHTLLFVHGAKSYACISKLVVLMFYKASLLAWQNFIFGGDSCFTGQQWYNDSLYQLYNIIYTAWPVLILATLDRALPPAVAENSPAVFREQRGRLFSGRVFAGWMLRSLLHSAFVYVVPRLILTVDGNDIMGGPSDLRGKTFSFWYSSTLQLAVLSVLPNLMALFLMESVSLLHWVAVLGSSVTIFAAIALLALFPVYNYNIYDITSVILQDPMFWLQFLLLLLLPLAAEIAWRYIHLLVDGPTLGQVLKERTDLRSRRYWALAAKSPENPLRDPLEAPAHARGNYTSFQEEDAAAGDSARLRSSSMQSSSGASAAVTEEPEACWAVQVLGPDPDLCCVQAPDLFGEGAGWGVRATASEEKLVGDTPGDRSLRIRREAETVLRCTDRRERTSGTVMAGWEGVADRLGATKVARALATVRQHGHQGGFHSAADQAHEKRDAFAKNGEQ